MFLSFLPADEYKRGAAAETDEFFPKVEKALLQTERPNSLLCQRCQGNVSYMFTVGHQGLLSVQ